jgi:hypothetical protein
MMKDFYYILGTNENCTFDEIKDAYRKLSKKFHPDLNQNDKYFESRFKELQEAYETLSDPARRRKYDAALKKSRATGPIFQEPKRQPFRTTGIDIMFSIVLIAITFVFGSYVIKAMTGDRAKALKITPQMPVTADVVLTAPIVHKKHHHLIKIIATPNKVNPEVTVIQPLPVKSVPAVPIPEKPPIVLTNRLPAATKVVAKPATDSSKSHIRKNFLYATIIKSNITGVTNMHQVGNYGSAIVKVIPNNSKVLVLAKGETYYKVQFDNASGYVPKWTLASN